MTGPIDDEALLATFRDWLREARDEAVGPPGRDDPVGEGRPEVGLYRLAEEMTALRHEVKLGTKGSRGLQEQVEALLPALERAIDQFRAVAPKEEKAALEAARPLAEALADLDEALDRGKAEVEKARARRDPAASPIREGLDALFEAQPWYRRWWTRAYHDRACEVVDRRESEEEAQPGLLDALREGYDLTRARLRRAMDAGQVRRIECVGRPVDPTLMAVVGMVDAVDAPPGTVVDEVRRGYTWRGRVLRFAEVRAARERPATTPEDDEYDEDEDEDEEEPQPRAD